MSGGQQIPVIRNSSTGVIIRHKEYLGDILPSTPFASTNFFINPGLSATFPWLAPIANNFEQYEWRGLVFEFRSMSGDALTSTNTALGTVIMATDYNVLAAPFTNKSAMENNEYSTSCKPSSGMIHPIECARGQTPVTRLYTRNSEPPANSDQRLYDIGRFQIATQGMQSDGIGVIGELWASYEIKFLKPQVSTNNQFNLYYDHYTLGQIGDRRAFLTAVKSAGSNLGTTTTAGSDSIITFPATANVGRYAITYHFGGDTATAAAGTLQSWTPVPLTNCTLVNDQEDNSGGQVGFVKNQNNTTDKKSMWTLCEVDVVAVPATIQFFEADAGYHVPVLTEDLGGDVRIFNVNNTVF